MKPSLFAFFASYSLIQNKFLLKIEQNLKKKYSDNLKSLNLMYEAIKKRNYTI